MAARFCRACGSENLEVLPPAGPGVGTQFACDDCRVIADSCGSSGDELAIAQAVVRRHITPQEAADWSDPWC